MATNTFTLNTGAKIPAIGLGTWQSPPGQVRQAVSHAICSGYTHIDCAYCYGNEAEVGQGIKAGLEVSGLKRSDLFITTKLWCTYHTRVEQCLDKSLILLGLEYVDLYLMHWPVAMKPDGNHEKFPTTEDGQRDLDLDTKASDTYLAMEKLLQTGKARAIGVCNFSKRFLEELLPKINIIPAVNQIENHPLLPQSEIVALCHGNGILVEAYSPLGSTGSPLMQLSAVIDIARELNTSAGTILLSYQNARGIVALPKSVTPERIEQNLEVVKLSPQQMDVLNSIARDNLQRMVYPGFGVNFGFPDKDFGFAHTAA